MDKDNKIRIIAAIILAISIAGLFSSVIFEATALLDELITVVSGMFAAFGVILLINGYSAIIKCKMRWKSIFSMLKESF